MSKTLTLDWLPSEPDFELFGINSHLKDYRITWLLNDLLAFDLSRIEDFLEDMSSPDLSSYAQFKWEDEVNHREIFLIANQPVVRYSVQPSGALFEAEKLDLLIPERPRTDYFIQLYGQFSSEELLELEHQLNMVPGVGLAERIDPAKLKSFVNLMH